jgi:S1-C subfamily serine protease
VTRAYLGIGGGDRPLPPAVRRELGRDASVEVSEVTPGSPAEAAGLRAEDLIVAVDGAAVSGIRDLQRLLRGDRIGAPVSLSVLRGGRRLELEAVPGELDA